MKATDLMIGDLVFYKNFNGILKPHKIIGISETYAEFEKPPYNMYQYDRIYPIPLTPEILEKNGFKEDSETKGIYWRPDCRKFCIVKELDTWHFAFRVLGKTVDKSSGYICISECNYVYKLQHKLKDLEIENEIIL